MKTSRMLRHRGFLPGAGRFLAHVRRAHPGLASARGQALIETALTLPLLLLLLLNGINFGFYIFGWITVNNAARAAVEYQVYNGVALGFLSRPSYMDVCKDVWYPDVSSLSNRGTGNAGACTWQHVQLKVCSKTGAAAPACTGTGVDVPPADPSTYTLYSADVTYTYAPLIGALTIPVINVPLTLLPPSIHRQIVMRGMQ